MSVQIAEKLSINNFSFSQKYRSFDKYPSQLIEVNGDGYIELIGSGDDSLAQSNVPTD